MANAVTSDLNVLALLKEYYGDQSVEALVFRNSPVLGKIKKERIGGKYIPLPMAVYGSGAVTSDYTQVTSQAANTFLGASMQVTPGQLFSSFVLDPKEYLASQGDKMAFLSVFAVRAMLAMDDLRKVLASCLYGQGFLDLGAVVAVDTNRLYIDVDPSTAMAVSPGSQIMFAPLTNGVPGTFRNVNAVTVSSIASVQSTGYTRITFSSTYDVSVAVADVVMIKGGRDTNLAPNAPIGLGQWLPTVGNRTGTAWTSYIATSFFGVVRSTAPDRLAGQFVQRNSGANETYTQAILRLVKNVRRGGGVPDLVVVNDDDFNYVMNDALANRTFYQQINASGNKGENAVTQGISQLQMSFSTSWLNLVVDDPYCRKGTFYVLDSDAVRLYGISNTAPILDALPTGNEPGAPKADSQGEPTTNFQFLVDDMYTTQPIALASGPGIRVDFQFYGNFAIVAPAHCGVGVF